MERRVIKTDVAIESRGEGQAPVMTGYAAVFFREGDTGTEYRLYPGASERIMPGAFSKALAESQDVRALFNHDINHVLGRSAANTLKLSVDERGLRYEVSMPDTQSAKDVSALIKRGDITGSSFSFGILEDNWVKRADGTKTREIRSVNLYDVGPVTFPAYTATSAEARAIGDVSEAKASLEKHETELQSKLAAYRYRARVAEID